MPKVTWRCCWLLVVVVFVLVVLVGWVLSGQSPWEWLSRPTVWSWYL